MDKHNHTPANCSTLIACSGGRDSSALAIALASAKLDASQRLYLGHVVHDLRPMELAHADRDAVAKLAAQLGLGFVERSIQVVDKPGNHEALARELRYDALGLMAGELGMDFIATAHHADDQLETLLMRLIRGSGLAGLGCIAPSRPLKKTSQIVIRPMLRISSVDAGSICKLAGWNWAEDHTNCDLSRLRASIRERVLPILDELAPGASERSAQAVESLQDVGELMEELAAALVGQAQHSPGKVCWKRSMLRKQKGVVVGSALRLAARKVTGDRGMDRLGGSMMRDVLRAIFDSSGEVRSFAWATGCIMVRKDSVTVQGASCHD